MAKLRKNGNEKYGEMRKKYWFQLVVAKNRVIN